MIFATIFIFILILGLLIFVHEFGHFLAAKKIGCKVEEFGFGFPPRILGKKIGETLYSLNAIPIGGFVRIWGEEGAKTKEEQKDPRLFTNKRIWQRFLVLFSGVLMNFILAMVLITLAAVIGMPTVLSGQRIKGKITNEKIQITEISPHSPAETAELKVGDTILGFTQISDLQAYTEENLGKTITLKIRRGTEEQEVSITPRTKIPAGEGPLGVGLVKTGIVRYPWYYAPWVGLKTSVNLTIQMIYLFGLLLKNLIAKGVLIFDISGPVGIAVLTGEAARLGFIYLLQLTVLLTINLAIINILPFPALDGGRLLFLVFEKIKGRKISQKVENIVHNIGFAILIFLMIAVTFNDIYRLRDRIIALGKKIINLF